MVKEIRSHFHEEIASFYNIFSPISYLKRWFRTDQSRGDQVMADFIKEDPETLAYVLDVIAGDISTLSRRLIQEAGVEGIYFSTQQVQDERVTQEEYRKVIEPSNIAVLEAANEAGGINILHICGFEGAKQRVASSLVIVLSWVVLSMARKACSTKGNEKRSSKKRVAWWQKLEAVV